MRSLASAAPLLDQQFTEAMRCNLAEVAPPLSGERFQVDTIVQRQIGNLGQRFEAGKDAFSCHRQVFAPIQQVRHLRVPPILRNPLEQGGRLGKLAGFECRVRLSQDFLITGRDF